MFIFGVITGILLCIFFFSVISHFKEEITVNIKKYEDKINPPLKGYVFTPDTEEKEQLKKKLNL